MCYHFASTTEKDKQPNKTKTANYVYSYFQFPGIVNPFVSNSDKHPISPYNFPTWSNIQVTGMNEMITKDEISWCLIKFSQLAPW